MYIGIHKKKTNKNDQYTRVPLYFIVDKESVCLYSYNPRLQNNQRNRKRNSFFYFLRPLCSVPLFYVFGYVFHVLLFPICGLKKQGVRKADNWIVVWPTELCPQLFRKSLKCVYTTHQTGGTGHAQ